MPATNPIDPSKVYLVRGSTIKKIQADLDDLRGGGNIQRGPGVLIRGSGSAGISIAARRTASEPPAAGKASGPFQVSLSTVGSGATPNRAVVSSKNSSLLRNYVLDNRQTITGLDSAFNFDYGNDLIYLEITIDPTTGLATAATVQSWGQGGTWAPSDLPGEYGTGRGYFEYQLTYDSFSNKIYTQYLARCPIFSSTTSTIAPYPVVNTQMLTTNLIMTPDIYSGALYVTGDGPAVIGISMPKPFMPPFIQP